MLPTWTVVTICWLLPGMLTFKLYRYVAENVEPYRTRTAVMRKHVGDLTTAVGIVGGSLLIWPVVLGILLRDRVQGYYGRPDTDDDGAED